MRNPISIVGAWLTKIESWVALGGMVIGTGLLVWLGNQWVALAAAGPAAVVMVASLAAALVILAISLAYISIAHFLERRQYGGYFNEHIRALVSDGIPFTRTQYMQYVSDGDYVVVSRFWEAGIVNVADRQGSTDLFYACNKGHAAMVADLIRKGCDPQRANESGRTPLMAAIAGSHTKVVEKLLEHKCAINATAVEGGYSALSIASYHGHKHLIELLLNEGANVNVVDHNNLTPLMVALAFGKWEIAEYLIQRGADLRRTDSAGATVMDYALLRGASAEIVQKIRDVGVEVATPRLKIARDGYSWPGKIEIVWRLADDEGRQAS